MTGVRRTLRAVRDFWAVQVELQERLILINRPWEQDLLHWCEGELHGEVAPPADGRRRSITPGGWCACPHSTAVQEGDADAAR
jgi:hypothetical protein